MNVKRLAILTPLIALVLLGTVLLLKTAREAGKTADTGKPDQNEASGKGSRYQKTKKARNLDRKTGRRGRLQFQGTVVDSAGKPIANALVALRIHRSIPEERIRSLSLDSTAIIQYKAESNHAGKFTIVPRTSSEDTLCCAVLTATHSEFPIRDYVRVTIGRDSCWIPVKKTHPSSRDIVLTLHKPASLILHVPAAVGTITSTFQYFLLSGDGICERSASFTLRETAYDMRLTNVTPGRKRLIFRTTRGSQIALCDQGFSVPENGEHKVWVSLQMGERYGGVVETSSGQGVSGAHVRLTLRMSAIRGSSIHYVDWYRSRVTGVLTSTGVRQTNFWNADMLDREGYYFSRRTTTDEQGRFSIGGLPKERMELSVVIGRDVIYEETQFPREDVHVILRPKGATIRVVPDGVKERQLQLAGYNIGGESNQFTVLKPPKYISKPFRPGRYWVILTDLKNDKVWQEVLDLKDGDAIEVRPQWKATGSLVVRLKNKGGDSEIDTDKLTILLRISVGNNLISFPIGLYKNWLPPGLYTVVVRGEGLVDVEQSVQITGSETAECTIQLKTK